MSLRTNVVFLHGIESQPGAHWQRWLSERLAAAGHVSYLLELPRADAPDRFEWLDHMGLYGGSHDPAQLVLVGHSIGVVTALDFIERATEPVKGFVSVSGFGHDYGNDLNTRFLSATGINFDAVRNNLESAAVFLGDDDPYVPQTELHALANELHVTPFVVPRGRHLNTDSGYTEFPQLFEVVSSLAA